MPAAPVRVYGYWEDAEGAPALGTVSLQRMDTIQDVAVVIIGAQVERVSLVDGAIDTEVIGCDPDDPNPLAHFYRVTERIRATDRALTYDIEVDADSADVDLTAVARVDALPDPLFTYEPAGSTAAERDRALAAEAALGDAIPVPSDVAPEPLGTADPGTSGDFSRGDHVHDMPSATDVGADPAGTSAAAITALGVGEPDGVATLDGAGKVPSAQLPTALALGETAGSAYRGDRGKVAYDHSQEEGNPHGTTATDVGADPAGTAAAAVVGKLDASDIGDTVQAHSAVLDATTASFTTADATKLDGIEEDAEKNVQSDWAAPSGDAHILNKPTLGTAAGADTTDFDPAGAADAAASGKLDASDPSVTNARTPTAHKTSHATGGSDALVPADIGALAPGDTIPGTDVSVDLTAYAPLVTAADVQQALFDAFAALVGLGGDVGTLYSQDNDLQVLIGNVSDAAAASDAFLLDLAVHAINQATSRILQSVRFSLTAVPGQTITAANRIGAGLHTWPDGNIGFATISGTTYAFAPNGEDSARNTATPTNLRGTVQQTALVLSTLQPADYAGGGDIYNTGSRLIKLWHGEAHVPGDPTRFISFHGLATATTAAPDTWTDMGRIITAEAGTDPTVATADLANNSMIVYGSWVYVFFSERTTSTRGAFSVARAPLADVVTWAGGGAAASFSKWYRNGWTEPGIGGKSSEIMPGAPYPSWAAIIRVSGLADRFVMVWTNKVPPVTSDGNQWAVYAAMSEPGSLTEWGEPELLLGPTPSAELTYITLADATDLSTHVTDSTTMKLYLVSSALGSVGGNRWTDAEVLVFDFTVYAGKTDTQGGLSRWFSDVNDPYPVTAFGSVLGAGGLAFGPSGSGFDTIFLRTAAGILHMAVGTALSLPQLRLTNLGSLPAGPNVVGAQVVVGGVPYTCVTAGTPGTWEAGQTSTVGSWVTPTLLNSWLTPVLPCRYRRIGRNEVEIDLQAITGGASGSVAFNLPSGFRPSADEPFYVYCTAAGDPLAQAQVVVKTTGNVEIAYAAGKGVVTGRLRMMTV